MTALIKTVLPGDPDGAAEVQQQIVAQKQRNQQLRLQHLALQQQLAVFEQDYQQALRVELAAHTHLQDMLRGLVFAARQLRVAVCPPSSRADTSAQVAVAMLPPSPPMPPSEPLSTNATDASTVALHVRGKKAFHRLARCYHPDLIQTSDKAFGEALHDAMAYINRLYQQKDLTTLLQLAAQVEEENHLESQLHTSIAGDNNVVMLKNILQRLQQLGQGLVQQIGELQRSAMYKLWQSSLSVATPHPLLFFETLKENYRFEHAQCASDIAFAATQLEISVMEYNKMLERRPTTAAAPSNLTVGSGQGVYANLGLAQKQHIATLRQKIIEMGYEAPHKLHVLLLAHVHELAPSVLWGLETFAQVAQRYTALYPQQSVADFTQLLADMREWVVYGVRQQSDKRLRVGLFCCKPLLHAALHKAREHPGVQMHFTQLLQVLGEYLPCAQCQKHVFAVPLLRLGGIDDWHSCVCPHCGYHLRSYWLPKGCDVQSILNAQYVQDGLVHEYQFYLAGKLFFMQIADVERKTLSTGWLKQRLWQDVFVRNGITLLLTQVDWIDPRSQPSCDSAWLYEQPAGPYTLLLRQANEAQVLMHIEQSLSRRFTKAG